jgi:hypothetical protein
MKLSAFLGGYCRVNPWFKTKFLLFSNIRYRASFKINTVGANENLSTNYREACDAVNI